MLCLYNNIYIYIYMLKNLIEIRSFRSIKDLIESKISNMKKGEHLYVQITCIMTHNFPRPRCATMKSGLSRV